MTKKSRKKKRIEEQHVERRTATIVNENGRVIATVGSDGSVDRETFLKILERMGAVRERPSGAVKGI